MFATQKFNFPAIQCLLSRGADIDIVDLHGKTASDYALGFHKVVRDQNTHIPIEATEWQDKLREMEVAGQRLVKLFQQKKIERLRLKEALEGTK